MAKKTKKPSLSQTLSVRHWEGMQRAQLVKDRYPQVSSIEIERITIPEAKWMGEPVTTTDYFNPESRAFFQYPCRYRDCVGGYLNLDMQISELVKRFGEQFSDKSLCDGWQDEERINRHKCLLETKFRIKVSYVETARARPDFEESRK